MPFSVGFIGHFSLKAIGQKEVEELDLFLEGISSILIGSTVVLMPLTT
jgi:hypothetical protein